MRIWSSASAIFHRQSLHYAGKVNKMDKFVMKAPTVVIMSAKEEAKWKLKFDFKEYFQNELASGISLANGGQQA